MSTKNKPAGINPSIFPSRLGYVNTLNFQKTSFGRSKFTKLIAGAAGFSVLTTLVLLGTTLAANINLNSGTPVEFGQGVAQATSCTGTDSLLVTPYSGFDNSLNEFTLSDITVSHIPDSCLNKDFIIRIYSDSGILSFDSFSSTARVPFIGADTATLYSGISGNSRILGVITNSTDTGGYGAFTIHFTAGNPGVLGSKPLATDVKRISIESIDSKNSMVTYGLKLALNANNPASYSSGDTWYDLSPNHNDFKLYHTVLNTKSATSDRNFFPFRDDFSMAIHESGDVALNAAGTTLVVVTRISTIPTTGDGWHTLIRGYWSDHAVLLGPNEGTYLGTFQNGRSNWLSTSLDVSTMPSYGTNKWETFYIRFQEIAPYMTVSAGSDPGTILGYSNDSFLHLQTGVYALGNYQGGTQPWGDIAAFYMYNRILSAEELLQDYQALN